MENARRFVRLSLAAVGRVEIAVAAAILSGIVAMIVTQVALGAGLGRPIAWEQEAGAYGLVWMTFLGASVALKQMRHVTIVSFVGSLPPRLRSLVRALVYAAMLWTLAMTMRELPGIMAIEARSETIALPVQLPRSYFFSVPLTVSCALLSVTALLYLAESLIDAARPGGAAGAAVPVMEDAP